MIGVIKTSNSEALCGKNNSSIGNLKKCIKENNVIMENIYGLKSLEKFYLLDQYRLYNFVQPKDGSIKFSPHNTFQLGLDPKYEYSLTFFDKIFMMLTMNPDIVKRNILNIKKGIYSYIYLRVKRGVVLLSPALFSLSGN